MRFKFKITSLLCSDYGVLRNHLRLEKVNFTSSIASYFLHFGFEQSTVSFSFVTNFGAVVIYSRYGVMQELGNLVAVGYTKPYLSLIHI